MFSEYKGLRKELYVLFIGRVMTCLGSMISPMMTLILSNKLGMSASEIANYFIIVSVIEIPIGLWGGKLTDKLNKRNIIIVCDLFSVICYMYCGFVELSTTIIVIIAIASLFQTIEYPAYDALIADFTTPKDRERAFSLEYLGSNLGLVLAPTLGGILVNNYLWLIFIINAVCILSSTILIFFKIKDVTRQEDENDINEYENVVDDKAPVLPFILRNRVLIVFIISCIFSNTLYHQFSYLMPLDMAAQHGEMGSVVFGTLNSINCIVVVLFTAYITRKYRRVGETDKFIIGDALKLLGLVIFRLMLPYIWVSYIAMIIFTFGEIFSTLANAPFTSKRIPANYRGRFSSINSVIVTIVVSLSDKLIGVFYDLFGSLSAWSVAYIFGLITIALNIVIKRCDKKDYSNLYKNV